MPFHSCLLCLKLLWSVIWEQHQWNAVSVQWHGYATRLLPENLSHCLRVSVEAPIVLTEEQAIDIVKMWHAQSPHRRIQV